MRRIKQKKEGIAKIRYVDDTDARPLVTVPPTDPVWDDTALCTWSLEKVCNGEYPLPLVRLQPPHHASDGLIQDLKRWLEDERSAGVRVERRSASPKVVNDEPEDETMQMVRKPREVIEAMVARAHTDDRDALSELVEDILSAAEAKHPRERTHALVNVGHITGIRLENWGPFKGEHVLELEPTIYSITAEHEDDPERSNWLGKSFFLNAIVFCLTGKFPTATADEWIHGQEPQGGVDLMFANGLFISRWKPRGKSTQVEVLLDGNSDQDEPDYTQAAAQRYIDESVISLDTLTKTRWFEQKMTDRIITMKPAERTQMVNDWLDIEWLGSAEDDSRQRLNALTETEAQHRAKIASIAEEYDDLDSAMQTTLAGIKFAQERIDDLQHKQELTKDHTLAVGEWKRTKREADRYAELKAKQDEAEPVPEKEDDVEWLLQKEQECKSRLNAAELEVVTATRLASGEFDGKCPVAGIQCPAAESINAERAPHRKRLKLAKDAKESCAKEYQDAYLARTKATAAKSKREREAARAEQRLEEMKRLKPSADFIAKNPEPPKADEDTTSEALAEARGEMTGLEAERRNILKAVQAKIDAEAALAELKPRVTVHREAMAILGRNGAQRIIAEKALDQIETNGNRAIAAADIDLQFEVRWSAETKKPAEACDTCGSPFPSSARVKQCTRCGAERGRKLSYGLRLQLSNVSGGAEDLGSVMFQLSAADWLSKYGETQWPIFLIDEPFGALDRAHVRRLSNHFTRLLSEQFGASQAFIVAHHADVLESAPGRIHIVSSGGISKVSVHGQ